MWDCPLHQSHWRPAFLLANDQFFSQSLKRSWIFFYSCFSVSIPVSIPVSLFLISSTFYSTCRWLFCSRWAGLLAKLLDPNQAPILTSCKLYFQGIATSISPEIRTTRWIYCIKGLLHHIAIIYQLQGHFNKIKSKIGFCFQDAYQRISYGYNPMQEVYAQGFGGYLTQCKMNRFGDCVEVTWDVILNSLHILLISSMFYEVSPHHYQALFNFSLP